MSEHVLGRVSWSGEDWAPDPTGWFEIVRVTTPDRQARMITRARPDAPPEADSILRRLSQPHTHPSHRVPRAERPDAVRRLRDAGLTNEAIASEVGWSLITVYRDLRAGRHRNGN